MVNGINPLNGHSGEYTVYRGFDKYGNVKYVGITKREPEIRYNEHWNSGSLRSGLEYEDLCIGLTYYEARSMEQTYINKYGLPNLYNRINSISPRYWGKYNIKP